MNSIPVDKPRVFVTRFFFWENLFAGMAACLGLVLILGLTRGLDQTGVLIAVGLMPLAVVGFYLRYLIWASRRIELTPSGLTNQTRSGKTYAILWKEVKAVRVKLSSGVWFMQGYCAITTWTGHRVYFADEGIKFRDWLELTQLVQAYSRPYLDNARKCKKGAGACDR